LLGLALSVVVAGSSAVAVRIRTKGRG